MYTDTSELPHFHKQTSHVVAALVQEVQVGDTDGNQRKVGRGEEAQQNAIGHPLPVALGVSGPDSHCALADERDDIHWALADDHGKWHAKREPRLSSNSQEEAADAECKVADRSESLCSGTYT